MEIALSKKTILSLLVFLWIVFSVAYIANNLWSNYRDVQLFGAYEQGRVDTINALIQEAEKCEQVSVYSNDKEISLIAVHCLTEMQE